MPYEANKTYTMTVLFASAKRQHLNVQSADRKETFQIDIHGELAQPIKTLKDKKVEVVCTGEVKDAQPQFVLSPKYFVTEATLPLRGKSLNLQEGQKIEFKKSILFSPSTNQPGENQLQTIAREIAAFMNSDGGNLYCGVDDDGYVTGIENDIKHLSEVSIRGINGKTDKDWGYKENNDGFSQKIRNIVRFYLGDMASTFVGDPQFVKDESSGRVYVIVNIRSSTEDFVYLGSNERVYYRTGTSAVLLEGRAREQYARKRFHGTESTSLMENAHGGATQTHMQQSLSNEGERIVNNTIAAPLEIKTEIAPKAANSTLHTETPQVVVSNPVDEMGVCPQVVDSLNHIKFACEDLPEFVEGNVSVFSSKDKSAIPVPIDGDWDYVITLRCRAAEKRALEEVKNYWKCPYTTPDVRDGHIFWRFPEVMPTANATAAKRQLHTVGYFPTSLADYIGSMSAAKYRPDARKVANNLFADQQQTRQYLGTYFPRSFCETFCIFDYVFDVCGGRLKLTDEVSIVDLGIGTGGAAFGLVWALRKWFYSSLRIVNIVGIDGNAHALQICDEISCVMSSLCPMEIRLTTKHMKIRHEAPMLEAVGMADFVIASKSIQEFAQDFGYADFLDMAERRLKDTGLAMILDIAKEERCRALSNCHERNGLKCVMAPKDFPETEFHVISSLTEQNMSESIVFGIWAHNDADVDDIGI